MLIGGSEAAATGPLVLGIVRRMMPLVRGGPA